MNKAVLYIHGKGGNAAEAEHYKPLFPDSTVIGFDYKAKTPWEAKSEFTDFFDEISTKYDAVILVADSIGAFFAMNARTNEKIEEAYFISPIVDMEKLILTMMKRANVTEEELRVRKKIETPFGETLSFEYLCYVRSVPTVWNVKTHILYGEKDHLTDLQTVSAFAKNTGASLDVMAGGEHWFHTEEQMAYLDRWIGRENKKN